MNKVIRADVIFHHSFDALLWFSLWMTYNNSDSWMQYVGAGFLWFLAMGAFFMSIEDGKIQEALKEYKNENLFYSIYNPGTFLVEVFVGMYLGWWSAIVYGFFGILCYVKLFQAYRA